MNMLKYHRYLYVQYKLPTFTQQWNQFFAHTSNNLKRILWTYHIQCHYCIKILINLYHFLQFDFLQIWFIYPLSAKPMNRVVKKLLQPNDCNICKKHIIKDCIIISILFQCWLFLLKPFVKIPKFQFIIIRT